MSQDYKETIKGLSLPGDTTVTLTYADGCDVFVHNDTAVEDAVNDTDVVRRFSDLVIGLGGDRMGGILADLADAGVLELPDPDDEDDGAAPYDAMMLAEAIEDNFYDQEFIEYSIKKYDHKRGHCTLTATVEVTVDELLNAELDLTGWELEVKLKSGKLKITC